MVTTENSKAGDGRPAHYISGGRFHYFLNADGWFVVDPTNVGAAYPQQTAPTGTPMYRANKCWTLVIT